MHETKKSSNCWIEYVTWSKGKVNKLKWVVEWEKRLHKSMSALNRRYGKPWTKLLKSAQIKASTKNNHDNIWKIKIAIKIDKICKYKESG